MLSRKFKPGLVPTLVVVLLFPILVRLGFWQLDRAEEKEQIQTLFEQRAKLPAITLDHLPEDLEEIKYRRVVLTGHYDRAHHILLDNKVYQQAAGYHVLTPVKLSASGKVVLVNRGWVPGGLDRRVLPEIESPTDALQINGVISLPSSKVFTLSEYNRAGTSWPAVYQWIDFADIGQATGMDILPLIVLQDPEDEHGYVRNWSKVDLKPEKNISYAVQWFALALALLIIYIVVNLRKVDVPTDE
ncbi:MAG: SURF1 family protein [Gammaproteobacteria bacterium]